MSVVNTYMLEDKLFLMLKSKKALEFPVDIFIMLTATLFVPVFFISTIFIFTINQRLDIPFSAKVIA